MTGARSSCGTRREDIELGRKLENVGSIPLSWIAETSIGAQLHELSSKVKCLNPWTWRKAITQPWWTSTRITHFRALAGQFFPLIDVFTFGAHAPFCLLWLLECLSQRPCLGSMLTGEGSVLTFEFWISSFYWHHSSIWKRIKVFIVYLFVSNRIPCRRKPIW